MSLKPEWTAAYHKASRFENSRRAQAAATQRKLVEFVIARGGVSFREHYTTDPPNAIIHTLYARLPDGANGPTSLFELGRDMANAAGLTLVALHVNQKREFDRTPGPEDERSELCLWVKLTEDAAYADVPPSS